MCVMGLLGADRVGHGAVAVVVVVVVVATGSVASSTAAIERP